MTVTLELKPEVEVTVKAQADARGVPVETYLQTLIETAHPSDASARIKQRNIEQNAAAMALLDTFLESDEYGDEQEQREALEYLRKAVDEDRPGQRRIFGEGFNP